MTFTLPEELATKFTRRVPARDRSRYVADAIAHQLAQREARLMRACEIANHDPAVRTVEAELDALSDEILEPWDPAPSR